MDYTKAGGILGVKFQVILNRAIWLYLLIAIVFLLCVDHKRAVQLRGRYLLGVFYNQDLANFKDGVVYFDYMRHVKPKDPRYDFFLGYSYLQMANYKKAYKYFNEALQQSPNNLLWKQYLDYADDQLNGGLNKVNLPADIIEIPIEFK